MKQISSRETLRTITVRRPQSQYAAPGDAIFASRPERPSILATGVDGFSTWPPMQLVYRTPRPTSTRRATASLMASQGYSAAQIAAHLGHADGGVLALKTYIHPNRLESAEFVDTPLS